MSLQSNAVFHWLAANLESAHDMTSFLQITHNQHDMLDIFQLIKAETGMYASV